jgi:elongation factor 1-beta
MIMAQWNLYVPSVKSIQLLDALNVEKLWQNSNVQNVDLKGLKMATVILTFKIMPESPEVDLSAIEEKAKEVISNNKGELGKAEIEPIAFGLKALNLFVTADEAEGSPDEMEDALKALEGVQSCEVTDVRRAIG